MRFDLFGFGVQPERDYIMAFPHVPVINRIRKLLLLAYVVMMVTVTIISITRAQPVFLLAVWACGLITLGNLVGCEKLVAERIAKMFYGTTDSAWQAAFIVAFTQEYPRWREFAALNRRHSPEFIRLKDEFEAEWLSRKPTYRFNLSREALSTIIGLKHDMTNGKGFLMHKIYRDWEVAQESFHIKRYKP